MSLDAIAGRIVLDVLVCNSLKLAVARALFRAVVASWMYPLEDSVELVAL